ncbi:DUF1871 family protein [Cognatilysobacter bugurensis]|nr:DUF1871 family protein [Lysobacter bugurensis]
MALEIVGRLIRAWDPYSLIAEGAPADEFGDEIAKIVARIPRCRDVEDVAKAISAVFSDAFEPGGFSPVDCFEPAQEIYMALGRAKLLPAA